MAKERQRSSSDGEAKKKQLMDLPTDTLVDIFLRLPAKSVCCIKCVSKTFLNMVSNISFSTIHTRSLIAANSTVAADQVPRIMCCSRDHRLVTLQSLKYKDNTITKGKQSITVSSSTALFLRFVFCNVFGLGSKDGDCILVNGLGERGVLRLPKISFARLEGGPNVYRNSLFGMGFDDKTNTYKIVSFVCVTDERDAHHARTSMRAYVLVLGTNSWRQVSSSPPCELSYIRSVPPVCANGAVHWWTVTLSDGGLGSKILSFDLRNEEFCWTSTPHRYSYADVGLFSLRGCLAIAETKRSRSEIDVWVLKSFDEKKWVRFYYNNKLQDDFPYEGSPREWEHGIFFMRHDFCQTWLFFIDLRSGSINRIEYSSYKVMHHEYTKAGDSVVSSYTETILLGMPNYSESLISLKDYGDLEEACQVIA